MAQQPQEIAFLLEAGGLLLEYNECSAAIERLLESTGGKLLGSPCHVTVAAQLIIITHEGQAHASAPIRELRFNMSVVAQVYAIVQAVMEQRSSLDAALPDLAKSRNLPPPHPRWLVASGFGLGAAALARLLGADWPATVVAGTAAGLGLILRQWMALGGFSFLTLPLAAAFLGALIGGLAIRFGWTQSPELVLVVPALMLVPGAHFLNGLLDLFDRQVPMALTRFGLALALLLAAGLGVAIGAELTVANMPRVQLPPAVPGLVASALFACLAACGFAFSYNCLWPQIGLVAVAGLVGNSVRLAAKAAPLQPEVAAFLGACAVGWVAGWLSRATRTPVAVIAFAAAVTMMPGLSMYRALSGMFTLARLGEDAPANTVTATLACVAEASLILAGLAAGLVFGVRLVQAILRWADGRRPAQP